MSDASIMQTLVLNQQLAFTTSTGIDRVKVHNDSGYYLRVYFGLGPPSNAMGSGWHATVSPGASPVVPVVGAAAGAEGLDFTNSRTTGTYQGQVIVLPFLPSGALLSSGGVLTGASLCYLTSYFPGEYAEPGGQIDAFVQGGKQARYQAIGGATERWVADASSADASKDLTLVNGASYYTLTPSRAPNLFNAWNDTATWVNGIGLNHYYYGSSMHWRRTAAGAAGVVGRLEAVMRNPADAFDVAVETLGRYQFGDTVAGTQNSAEHSSDQPTRPVCVTLFVSRGGDGLKTGDIMRLRWIREATAGSWTLLINADVLLDMVNQSILTDIPYVPVTFASPADAPYNANSNPQTW